MGCLPCAMLFYKIFLFTLEDCKNIIKTLEGKTLLPNVIGAIDGPLVETLLPNVIGAFDGTLVETLLPNVTGAIAGMLV